MIYNILIPCLSKLNSNQVSTLKRSSSLKNCSRDMKHTLYLLNTDKEAIYGEE